MTAPTLADALPKYTDKQVKAAIEAWFTQDGSQADSVNWEKRMRAALAAADAAMPQGEAVPFAYWAQSPLVRVYAEMPGGMGLEWHPLYATPHPAAAEPVNTQMLEALKDTTEFIELYSNRWDGFKGKHPFGVYERAKAAITAAEAAHPAPTPQPVQHLTPQAVESLIERLRTDPALALATLRAAGIATADGKLSERYGGPAVQPSADSLRAALAEADRIMGHDDAMTEWRERWAHLWGQEGTKAQPSADKVNAERYRWLRARVRGERHLGTGHNQGFAFPSRFDLSPLGDIMRGSVAQHLDAAIDAARARTGDPA